MVNPQETSFWRTAERSGLLSPEQLRACWESIPEDKRAADAADRRLARQAISAGFITLWQAQQLLTGRTAGYRIDRYLVLERLGQGGMGLVYLAKDTRLGRSVALKVLSAERMNNPRAITRFHREAKIGAQLQHENLVRIYDEGESFGRKYLVMEYIEGKNVGQIIGEQGAIPWGVAARIVRQVALGLQHAHSKGLIHRDVNPCNIIVSNDGPAKLTDLGLAIDLSDQDAVTRDGSTVGTFDYIAPEQARRSRDADARSDIYSLGCTFYHMITGQVPFPAPSLPEKLYAHQLGEPDPIRNFAPDTPFGLTVIVQKMMRKDPKERFQTLTDVAVALREFSDSKSALRVVDSSAGGVVAQDPAVARVAAASVFGSDAGLASLPVDLGPESWLTEGLKGAGRTKKKSKSDEKSPESLSAERAAASPRSKRLMRWLIGAVTVAVLSVAGAAVLPALMAGSKTSTERSPGPFGGGETDSSSLLKPSSDGAEKGGLRILVKSKGEQRQATNLKEAVSIAQGNHGEVVISGRGRIELTGENWKIARRLSIRAEEASEAELNIAADSGSWLLGSSDSEISLRGLTIRARFDRPNPKRAPLIRTGGDLTLVNCRFLAEGETAGSQAAAIDGMSGSVSGCLFQGFDRVFDVNAYPGCRLSIKQSMFVPSINDDVYHGCAARITMATAGPKARVAKSLDQPKRRLEFDQCTFQGESLFELSGFSAEHPLSAEIIAAAVRSRRLFDWNAKPAELSEGLRWVGLGNRFDVSGEGWLTTSAESPGSKSAIAAPADYDQWIRRFDERDGAKGPIRFAADERSGSGSGRLAGDPREYAIVNLASGRVGADPARVGPGGAIR